MTYRNRFLVCALVFAWSHSLAQDFEFSLDNHGNAYYADSVQVFNQNLDSAILQLSYWTRENISSEFDTLEFKQGVRSRIYVSRMAFIKKEEIDSISHFFRFKMIINLDNQLLRYRIEDIVHFNPELKLKCRDLGSEIGSCEFENEEKKWNLFRKEVDNFFSGIISNLQNYLSSR